MIHLTILGCSDQERVSHKGEDGVRHFSIDNLTSSMISAPAWRAAICQRDEYLLELVRYIHLNSVRSKLVQRPEQYRYNWRRLYLGGREAGKA